MPATCRGVTTISSFCNSFGQDFLNQSVKSSLSKTKMLFHGQTSHGITDMSHKGRAGKPIMAVENKKSDSVTEVPDVATFQLNNACQYQEQQHNNSRQNNLCNHSNFNHRPNNTYGSTKGNNSIWRKITCVLQNLGYCQQDC